MSKGKARLTRVPADFHPEEADIILLRKRTDLPQIGNIGIDKHFVCAPARIAEFILYWQREYKRCKKDGVKRDWFATYRNRIAVLWKRDLREWERADKRRLYRKDNYSTQHHSTITHPQPNIAAIATQPLSQEKRIEQADKWFKQIEVNK